MTNNVRFVFCNDPENPENIHPYFSAEAEALNSLGIKVGINNSDDASILIWRSLIPQTREEYPTDPRFINSWHHYNNLSDLSIYYPHIADLTIPTFFVNDLSTSTEKLIKQLGWSKVFIKNRSKSLFFISDEASVWPDNSMEKIKSCFEEYLGVSDLYCIRKYVHFENEQRYWVMNGNIFHSSGIIPKVVIEAEKKLRELGSKYYTIDSTPEFIVEVNPGESSDRHGINSPELFASWLYKSFVLV